MVRFGRFVEVEHCLLGWPIQDARIASAAGKPRLAAFRAQQKRSAGESAFTHRNIASNHDAGADVDWACPKNLLTSSVKIASARR